MDIDATVEEKPFSEQQDDLFFKTQQAIIPS